MSSSSRDQPPFVPRDTSTPLLQRRAKRQRHRRDGALLVFERRPVSDEADVEGARDSRWIEEADIDGDGAAGGKRVADLCLEVARDGCRVLCEDGEDVFPDDGRVEAQ